jgi:hypothetical protein
MAVTLRFLAMREEALRDLPQPLLFVGHPTGQLIAALVAVKRVFLAIGRLGRLEPPRSRRATVSASSSPV